MCISIHFNAILNDRQPKCCFFLRGVLQVRVTPQKYHVDLQYFRSSHHDASRLHSLHSTCFNVQFNSAEYAREWQVIKLKPEMDAIGEILVRQTTELTSFSFMLAPGINVTHGCASSSRQNGTAALSYCLSPSPHPFLLLIALS